MKFEGAHTALVTPFDASGRLDERAFKALIRRQIKSGIRGLVPCGSTGEAATLSHEEFRRCLEIACAESRGDVVVTAGIGTNATWKAVESAREAESLGVDALLLLTPYYNKPTQEGLYLHCRTVASQARLPIMLYNIPGRTAVNMAPATVARLAHDCPNIIAIKEASGSLDQVSEIMTLAPKGFTVMSGDDSLTLPMIALGARGVVSVASNIIPKQIQALCGAAIKGDYKTAAALHLEMFPLVKALFVETNPIPVKAALAMMGLCRPTPRLPLTPLAAPSRTTLKNALARYGVKS